MPLQSIKATRLSSLRLAAAIAASQVAPSCNSPSENSQKTRAPRSSVCPHRGGGGSTPTAVQVEIGTHRACGCHGETSNPTDEAPSRSRLRPSTVKNSGSVARGMGSLGRSISQITLIVGSNCSRGKPGCLVSDADHAVYRLDRIADSLVIEPDAGQLISQEVEPPVAP